MHAVLLAYDGSESARGAAKFAIEMASRYGASLHVLAVAGDRDLGLEIDTESLLDQQISHSAELLSELDLGAIENVKTGIVVGKPVEEIIRYARDHQIDHIVVGHQGHGMFGRWMIGSVARHVVAYAPCPVTVVRQLLLVAAEHGGTPTRPEA